MFCNFQGHLHELGITCLGDRIYLAELIGLLKKKKREAELSAAKWSGVTPAPGIAYKEDCGECCLAYLCPCCLAKTYWRVTGQGVFYKREPPCGLWMEGKFCCCLFFSIYKYPYPSISFQYKQHWPYNAFDYEELYDVKSVNST